MLNDNLAEQQLLHHQDFQYERNYVKNLYKGFFKGTLRESEMITLVASDFIVWTYFLFQEIWKQKIKGAKFSYCKNFDEEEINGDNYTLKILRFLKDVITKNENSKQYYFLHCPPRLGKSTLILSLLIFQFIQNPVSHSMYFTCSDMLAKSVNPKISDVLRSVYVKKIAPYVTVHPKCDNREIIKTVYNNRSSGHNGQLLCATMDSTATGFGAGNLPAILTELFSLQSSEGIIVLDDPIKAQDAFNDNRQEDIAEHTRNAILSRRNSPYVPFLVTFQRTQEKDLRYRLEAGISKDSWAELVIPALLKNGKSIDETRYRTEELLNWQKTIPQVFYAQYQQAPIARGECLFNSDGLLYSLSTPKQENILFSFIACDTANVATAKADYTVMIHCYVVKNENYKEFLTKDETTRRIICKPENEHEIIKLYVNEIYMEKIDNIGINDKFDKFYRQLMSDDSIVKPKYMILEVAGSGNTLDSHIKNHLTPHGIYNKNGIPDFTLLSVKQLENKAIRFNLANGFINQTRVIIKDARLRKVGSVIYEVGKKFILSNEEIKEHLDKITASNVHLNSTKCDLADALAYGINNTFDRFEINKTSFSHMNPSSIFINAKSFFQVGLSRILREANSGI